MSYLDLECIKEIEMERMFDLINVIENRTKDHSFNFSNLYGYEMYIQGYKKAEKEILETLAGYFFNAVENKIEKLAMKEKLEAQENTSGEVCTDGRFELIEKYKNQLFEGTNIEECKQDMKAIDSILFRFWQMGWLDILEKRGSKKEVDTEVNK